MSAIQSIHAREILDARGNPTIEVDVRLEDGSFGRAAVPSGASTGRQEAFELRDSEGPRFGGKGVRRAVGHVNEIIGPAVSGYEACDQPCFDEALCALDGTEDKRRLGANAILGVSMAVARAAAASSNMPLYRYLGGEGATLLPVPLFNVLNGGAHADNSLDVEEFMVAPVGAATFCEALQMGAAVYRSLKWELKQGGHTTSVGDEGGFTPNLRTHEQAFELILNAVAKAGLVAGRDVVLAIDAAASTLYQDDGMYLFRRSNGRRLSTEQMIDTLCRLGPTLSPEVDRRRPGRGRLGLLGASHHTPRAAHSARRRRSLGHQREADSPRHRR